MGAALGHTQSLHTNALDEAIALPTDFSARIARNTQLYIQDETRVCKVIDPWGGSFYVEALTDEMIRRGWALIQEVEDLGGMANAIDTGLPKMRIEEAAARMQARIDSKSEKIIGVNSFRLEKEDLIEILEVDNSAVRQAQLARLEKLRAIRDPEKVRQALDAITHCMETGEGNLLELAVEAARVRSSLGEISDAIEKVSGRHNIRSISGIYSSEFSDEDIIEEVRRMTDEFERKEGRRPRLMVAKMGQDGHDRGAKVIATAFADMGFDVDMGALFQTAEETAQDAVDNDVHVIGMSSLAAGHKTLLPELVYELEKRGREDIMVVIGGVIPAQDYDFLRSHGASAIFGPGTVIPVAAKKVMEELNERVLV
jgi:methylmalonyl-CoA mutase